MSTEPHAVAVVHTRGGGEFCEDWHHAGRLAAKQNVLDDFAAPASWSSRT
jgi:prolyl oligopeptidase